MPEDRTHNPPRADFQVVPQRSGTLTGLVPRPADRGEDEEVAGLAYRVLEAKHPSYDAGYWRVCRALYAGGRKLFTDRGVMQTLFPPHRNEPDDVHAERVRRAFYINYPGEILDFIVSGLKTHPIEVMSETEADPYYEEFFEDVSAPDGKRQTFNQLLAHQILTALITRRAWTLIDFPRLAELEVTPETVAEEEALGASAAYAISVDPEAVFDWEEDGSGELIWANICIMTSPRRSIHTARIMVTKTYTVWNRAGWERYQITYPRRKPPKPDAIVPLVGAGVHTFGKVPLLRLELTDGLWAMNKLCDIAKEHFNKRSALAWAEYKSLFQERHEFLGDQDPMKPGPAIAEDENRAQNQVHGIGWTQQRYAGDRVEFIGPDSAPFAHALNSCHELRDEMHRVTYLMALAVDVGSAALRQSGDSKRENRAAHGVVLAGLGEILRDHAFDVTQTITTGRGDAFEWTASGASKFDTQSLTDQIEDAERLENVPIPSPTFQQRHKYMLARSKLGDEASEEDLEKIESELEEFYTAEEIQMQGGDLVSIEGEGEGEGERKVGELEITGEERAPAPGAPLPRTVFKQPATVRR